MTMPCSGCGSALALKEKGLRPIVAAVISLAPPGSALALKEKGLRPKDKGDLPIFALSSALALKEKGLRLVRLLPFRLALRFSTGPERKGIETMHCSLLPKTQSGFSSALALETSSLGSLCLLASVQHWP